MKRAPFYIDMGANPPAVVNGYTTSLLIDCDSTRLAVGLHKDNAGKWRVSELSTGLLVSTGPTRREAYVHALHLLAKAFPSKDAANGPLDVEATRAALKIQSGRKESVNPQLSTFATE